MTIAKYSILMPALRIMFYPDGLGNGAIVIQRGEDGKAYRLAVNASDLDFIISFLMKCHADLEHDSERGEW